MCPASCRDLALEMACDYVEGKLDVDTMRELDVHLGHCPNCMAFLRTYRDTSRIARDALRTEVPEDCTRLVMDFLDKKLPK